MEGSKLSLQIRLQCQKRVAQVRTNRMRSKLDPHKSNASGQEYSTSDSASANQALCLNVLTYELWLCRVTKHQIWKAGKSELFW